MAPIPHHQASDFLGGFPAVRRTLDGNGVGYEVVRHDPADPAMPGGRAHRAPLRRVVKTLAVWANERLVTVALPASGRVDMRRVQQLLDDPRALLAGEFERALDGVLHPFGPPAPPLVLLDRRVLLHNWVLVNGGDQVHSIRIDPLQIVRLSQARVADISAE